MASKIRPHPERERSEPSKAAHAPIHSQQKGLRSLPPLREVIARHGLTAKKSLGQNFILDLNVTRRIARAASTAMVIASSSQLHIARSPLACDLSAGLAQELAATIAWRARRRRGM